MTSAAWANLDFEEELAGPKSYRISPSMLEVLERWRFLLRLLPGARSARCLEGPEERPEGPIEKLWLWGVTATGLSVAKGLGLAEHFPALEAVRQVNDKLFSHSLEVDLELALPFAQRIDTLEALSKAVADCPHDWVLKHPLGFSGRERAVGKIGVLSDSARGWARRRITAGWSLLFEPWVEDKKELSLHFDLSREGQVRYLGHTELLSDAGGVYRGNAVCAGQRASASFLEPAHRIAKEVSSKGYWGPLGIDAMSGRLGDAPVLRPLTEINARYSFGRMALELGRFLPSGCSYSWHHPRRADPALPKLLPLPSVPAAGCYALPQWLDPELKTGTYVLVGGDSDLGSQPPP